MDNRQRRKQRKAKERGEEIRRKKHARNSHHWNLLGNAYPKVVLNAEGKHTQFINCLRESVESVSFSDERFTELERRFYRIMHSSGASAAFRAWMLAAQLALPSESQSSRNFILSRLINNLGEVIFSGIPLDVVKQHMPYVNFQVVYQDNTIVIDYEELDFCTISGSIVYSSPRRPTVRFHGVDYRIGFSKHAIERIESRMKLQADTYGAYGDVYGFFAKCVYVEPLVLYPDQDAFGLWDWAYIPGVRQYDVYVKKILGEENLDWNGGIPYYRLGYCPVAFERGFAVAKTFLVPGFTNTPEFGLILRNRSVDRETRQELMEAAKSLVSYNVVHDEKIGHIKWFHENGVPQVVQMEHEVFRYGSKPLRFVRDMPQLQMYFNEKLRNILKNFDEFKDQL